MYAESLPEAQIFKMVLKEKDNPDSIAKLFEFIRNF